MSDEMAGGGPALRTIEEGRVAMINLRERFRPSLKDIRIGEAESFGVCALSEFHLMDRIKYFSE